MAYDENGLLVPDPIPASLVLGETVSEHPVLAQLKEQIAKAEANVVDANRSKDYYLQVATERGHKNALFENALRSTLEELYAEQEISEEAATRIAEACGIEATKTVSVSGVINWSGTIEVSIFADFDNLSDTACVDNISVSVNGEDLDGFDYDMESTEVEDY